MAPVTHICVLETGYGGLFRNSLFKHWNWANWALHCVQIVNSGKECFSLALVWRIQFRFTLVSAFVHCILTRKMIKSSQLKLPQLCTCVRCGQCHQLWSSELLFKLTNHKQYCDRFMETLIRGAWSSINWQTGGSAVGSSLASVKRQNYPENTQATIFW